ncbi:MAG: 6-bladed beta-propeller [Longimicrobiales bacterium]
MLRYCPDIRHALRRAARCGALLATFGCSASSAEPPALTASATLSIGALDDPRYAFSQIEGISVGPDGHIFVLQHQDANIRVYDSTGVFVRLIGRRGMGPGEFSLPTKMWWSAGSFWVADGNLLRATRFDRNGTALERVPFRRRAFRSR